MMNKKIVGIMALVVMIFVGVCPAFAATSNSTSQTVTVKVNPTIAISVDTPSLDFGPIVPDGSSNTMTPLLTSKSNVAINVWIKALNFQSNNTATSDDLNLTDFTFDGTAFNGAYQLPTEFTGLLKAPKKGATTASLPLKITVPVGTSPADYNSTIFYSAVQVGQLAPATP